MTIAATTATESRFIFVDSDTGYIWGDETADTMTAALQQMLDDVGSDLGADDFETDGSALDGRSAYLVYTVPADFPAIPDGQDSGIINRLGRQGMHVETFVERIVDDMEAYDEDDEGDRD